MTSQFVLQPGISSTCTFQSSLPHITTSIVVALDVTPSAVTATLSEYVSIGTAPLRFANTIYDGEVGESREARSSRSEFDELIDQTKVRFSMTASLKSNAVAVNTS